MNEIWMLVLSGVLSVGLAGGCWWCARVSRKLDELSVHPQACLGRFADRTANKDSHERIWGRLDELGRAQENHEARIANVEQRCGCGKG